MRKLSVIQFPRGFSSVKRFYQFLDFSVYSPAEYFRSLSCSRGSGTENTAANSFFPLSSDSHVYIVQKSSCFPNCGAVGKPFEFLRISDCLVPISTCKFVVRICH